MPAPKRTGVPELDKMMRKARKQGGRVVKGKRHWQVFGPSGDGPVVVSSSRCSTGVVRGTRSRLRKVGLEV